VRCCVPPGRVIPRDAARTPRRRARTSPRRSLPLLLPFPLSPPRPTQPGVLARHSALSVLSHLRSRTHSRPPTRPACSC
jgi:hypothetical protein